MRAEMNTRFDEVDNRLRKVEVELSFVKDEMNGLKADLSTTPSRREFQELKSKVEKHYTINWVPHFLSASFFILLYLSRAGA